MSQDYQLLAYYLPQFHPIPQNDEWWGAGFTEWRNVVRAAPQFRGHHQPHLPGELGFYDLRVPEVREAQADLARAHGITGFVYYHYWFGGQRLLERPLEEVLRSGRPDFPFALCWANENWTRVWDGSDREILIAQDHSLDDDLAHFEVLLPFLDDPRAIRIDGRPLLMIYRPALLPDPRRTLETWRAQARRHGVGELYLMRVDGFREDLDTDARELGFDAASDWIPHHGELGRPTRWGRHWGVTRRLGLTSRGYGQHRVYDYEDAVRAVQARPATPYLRFPCVTPSWDNSARRRHEAFVLRGSTPEAYGAWLEQVVRERMQHPPEERVVFINAWNEWAEGNHLEPDAKWGRAYLEATRAALVRAGALSGAEPGPRT